MSDSLLVSIILPTYNRAEFLLRAINSVLIQDYLNWELIIWDDGSTDNTEEIVNSFSGGRIKYHRDTNHGVAYARNRAIEVSQGEYLAFLDSDDEWAAGKLSAQVEVMQANPSIEVLFGDFWNRNGSSCQDQSAFTQVSSVMKLMDVEQVEDGLFIIRRGLHQSLAIENFIATDSVMLRREILKRVGCFIEELRNSEDVELWWRMSLEGVCFAYSNEVYLTRYKLSGTLSGLSLLACENSLKALDICLQGALLKGRSDLVSCLNDPYRNAWQHMILLYADLGDPFGMIKAFCRSVKYGFRFGSIRFLLKAVTNPWLYKGRVG